MQKQKRERCNRGWSDGDHIRNVLQSTKRKGRPGRTPPEPTHRPITHRTGQEQDRNSTIHNTYSTPSGFEPIPRQYQTGVDKSETITPQKHP